MSSFVSFGVGTSVSLDEMLAPVAKGAYVVGDGPGNSPEEVLLLDNHIFIGDAAQATGVLSSATLLDSMVTSANVTQHEADLTILESQITDGSILARVASAETVTGAWTFGDGTGPVTVTIDAGAATQSDIEFHDAGTLRWKIRHTSGSGFGIERYDAAGVLQDEPIGIDVGGLMTLPNAADVSARWKFGASDFALTGTDSNFSNECIVRINEVLSGGIFFNLVMGDATRTLTFTGDATLNQDVDTTASPSFVVMTSTQATGTAPLVVASTTLVANLNADLLDGNEASAFALASHGHAATDITAGTFTAGAYSFAGSTIADLGIVATADINGGTLDGVTVGGSVAAAATVTTLTCNGVLTTGVGTLNDGRVYSDAVEVQTTDGTLTTIATIPLDDENLYQIEAHINGDASDGSNRITAEIKGSFFRTAAGSATQQGTTDLKHRERTLGTWNVTFAVSGNNVLVQVKGSDTVEWGGHTILENVSET